MTAVPKGSEGSQGWIRVAPILRERVVGSLKSEGSWAATVVVCAGTSWDAASPMPERHIAERLTRYAPFR